MAFDPLTARLEVDGEGSETDVQVTRPLERCKLLACLHVSPDPCALF